MFRLLWKVFVGWIKKLGVFVEVSVVDILWLICFDLFIFERIMCFL